MTRCVCRMVHGLDSAPAEVVSSPQLRHCFRALSYTCTLD